MESQTIGTIQKLGYTLTTPHRPDEQSRTGRPAAPQWKPTESGEEFRDCARWPLGLRAGPDARASRLRRALLGLRAFLHSRQSWQTQSFCGRHWSFVFPLRLEPEAQFGIEISIRGANYECSSIGNRGR